MELTIEKIQNDPYQNLVNYLCNDQTRVTYLRMLKKFLNVIPKELFEQHLQKSGSTIPELATLFVELAQKDIVLVKQIIHAYLRELKIEQKDNDLKNSFVKNRLKPIVTLFDANEINFSWKVINKSIPKSEIATDKAYTREELQTLMLASCDLVDKIIIVLFSSAGFRLGAWDHFTWNDVIFFTNPDGSHKGLGIRVYAGDTEEYWTHGTPEAAKILMLYREEWKKRFGEYPQISDPLIVPSRIYSYKTLRRLTSGGVAGRVRTLLKRAGLGGINVQQDNGFRKYFNTMCRRAKVFEEDREDMMGHFEGLQKHYERYEEQDFERFSEYQKAIPFLTIDDSERQKQKIIQQEKKITDYEKQKITIHELQDKNKNLENSSKLEMQKINDELHRTQDVMMELQNAVKEIREKK